jgi:plasmid maintenance system antidote protein VapI
VTHDDITEVLRARFVFPIHFQCEEAADRLDRYREALTAIIGHDRYGISPEMQTIVKVARGALK